MEMRIFAQRNRRFISIDLAGPSWAPTQYISRTLATQRMSWLSCTFTALSSTHHIYIYYYIPPPSVKLSIQIHSVQYIHYKIIIPSKKGSHRITKICVIIFYFAPSLSYFPTAFFLFSDILKMKKKKLSVFSYKKKIIKQRYLNNVVSVNFRLQTVIASVNDTGKKQHSHTSITQPHSGVKIRGLERPP